MKKETKRDKGGRVLDDIQEKRIDGPKRNKCMWRPQAKRKTYSDLSDVRTHSRVRTITYQINRMVWGKRKRQSDRVRERQRKGEDKEERGKYWVGLQQQSFSCSQARTHIICLSMGWTYAVLYLYTVRMQTEKCLFRFRVK